MLTGVLVEARYQIEDVRDRTRIRGVVLEKILNSLVNNNIPIATPKVRLENEQDWVEKFLNTEIGQKQ